MKTSQLTLRFRAICTPLARVGSPGILPVRFTGVCTVDGELEAATNLRRLGRSSRILSSMIDRLDPQTASAAAEQLKGIAISALDTQTLPALLEKIEKIIWPRFSNPSISKGCHPWQPPDLHTEGEHS